MQNPYFVDGDLNNLSETLQEYGVAIIPNLLSEKECDDMFNGMWEYFEHITSKFDTPMKRDDESTWREFFKLYPMHGMLIQHWQIGHAQFIWSLRENPKILKVFSKIWKNEDLLVSFDGASFHLPHEVTNRGYYRKNEWFHTDQTLTNSSFQCIQSWVTAKDVKPGDATLTFLEKSHNFHKEFNDTFQINEKKDWYKITKEEKKFFIDKGCQVKTIECPAGSLVLWDSRLFHAGKEPEKERQETNFRCVVYLCYTPRSLATTANLRKKQKAFKEKRLTSHWPHKVKLFPLNPRTYGNELPNTTEIPNPVLSDVGKRLAGF